MSRKKAILQYIMKYALKRPAVALFLVLYTMLDIAMPLLVIYYPKLIIEYIEKEDLHSALVSVVFFISLEFGLHILKSFVQVKIQDIQSSVNSQIYADVADIALSIPYQISESSEFIETKNKALAGINLQSGTIGICLKLCTITAAIVRIILSGAVLSALNPLFIVVILITILVNVIVYRYMNKLEEKFWNSLIRFNRMFSYIFMTLACNFKFAKESRLYAMADIIEEKNNEYIQYTKDVFKKKQKEELPYRIIHEVIGQLQMLLIYGYLLYSAFTNGIGVADFTVLLGISIALKGWLNCIIYGVVDINVSCNYFQYFYDLSEYKKSYAACPQNPIGTGAQHIIEFKNVFFQYENSNSFALSDVSVKLSLDENIAIVGMNGSGKTTFIKLLLRLYQPTKGSILLDGKNITEYKLDEYLNLFGTVFQDYSIYPMSIKENIVFNAPYDKDRLEDILEKFELTTPINNLQDGLDSVINDSSQPNVLRLSGGQEQKLVIARALYKKAPMLIMDEPTAALDPLSEYKIYQNVFQIAKEQHVIFTSHRMSCCRNADRILVFDNGCLVQDGVHQDLVDAHGTYRQLYMTQEKFYT